MYRSRNLVTICSFLRRCSFFNPQSEIRNPQLRALPAPCSQWPAAAGCRFSFARKEGRSRPYQDSDKTFEISGKTVIIGAKCNLEVSGDLVALLVFKTSAGLKKASGGFDSHPPPMSGFRDSGFGFREETAKRLLPFLSESRIPNPGSQCNRPQHK